jgi:hypothetical protein
MSKVDKLSKLIEEEPVAEAPRFGDPAGPDTKSAADIADELEEIQQQVKELMRDAKRLLSHTSEWKRASSYWYAHILGALDKEHGYMGGSMMTMADTIEALREEEPEDQEKV